VTAAPAAGENVDTPIVDPAGGVIVAICGVDAPRVAHTRPISTHPATVVATVGVDGVVVPTVDVFGANALTMPARDTPRYTMSVAPWRTPVDWVMVITLPASAAARFCADHTCDWCPENVAVVPTWVRGVDSPLSVRVVVMAPEAYPKNRSIPSPAATPAGTVMVSTVADPVSAAVAVPTTVIAMSAFHQRREPAA
jgi:hypothetical protein